MRAKAMVEKLKAIVFSNMCDSLCGWRVRERVHKF